MNFLADESVDRQIVDALREDDHAVLYVTEMDPGISDDEVLDKAEKDFGELVFRQQRITRGVVLVRLAGLLPSKKAEIASTMIKKHLDAIQYAFSVISPNAIRIRRIS